MIQDIFPLRYDVTYKKVSPSGRDIIFIFTGISVLCRFEGEDVVFPAYEELCSLTGAGAFEAHFLFSVDDTNYFYIDSCECLSLPGWEYVQKACFRELRPLYRAFTLITGFQIYNWYKNNSFCGKCGSPMVNHDLERAVVCTLCGAIRYPQICPSVIVGIINGDRILLTKYTAARSKFRRYALVAGYNEIGESLEDTVRREVLEEVGIRVKNITYFKSQPWSFTDSLLAGFFCEVDGDDTITLQEDELSEGRWFTRDEIPEESANPEISLTGAMIYEFKMSTDSSALLKQG